MIRLYLFLTIVFFSNFSVAQQSMLSEHALPAPEVPGILLCTQRPPDINTGVYTLNTDKSGNIDQEDPIKIFWIKYTEAGIHKPLNPMRNRFKFHGTDISNEKPVTEKGFPD